MDRQPSSLEPLSPLMVRPARRALRGALRAAGCAALLAALMPAVAAASTVSMLPNPNPDFSGDTLVYHASAGETNELTVLYDLVPLDRDQVGAWTITDLGATITAKAPCVVHGPHTAVCVPGQSRYLEGTRFELGDLNDRFDADNVKPEWTGSVDVFGGSGDDHLSSAGPGGRFYGDDGNDTIDIATAVTENGSLLKGGRGNDRITGGTRSDDIDGGGGRDELHGGDGHDTITDGDRSGAGQDLGPGPDIIDGGPGECCYTDGGDLVEYARRTAPLIVNLNDREPDGERDEGDRLIGIESVRGGAGDDRLIGNDKDNALYGGEGHDRFIARDGADTIRPGSGGSRITCGRGADWVEPSSRDLLGRDCESIDGQRIGVYWVLAYPTTRGTGTPGYRLSCPDSEEEFGPPDTCTGSIEYRDGDGRLLASGVLPLGSWENEVIALTISGLGQDAARRAGGVRANARLAFRHFTGGKGRGSRLAMRWRVRFKPPGG